MVIGGLWHGASWMYVIWGAYNGILLSIHKIIKKIYRIPDFLKGSRIAISGNIIITFTLVVVGMMFFRAHSPEQCVQMVTQIATDFNPQIIPSFIESYPMIILAIAGAMILHFLPSRYTSRTIAMYSGTPMFVQALILACVIFLVIQTRQSDLVPFVYLQY